MRILWPFILSSLAGLSTLIGFLTIFFPIKKHEEFLTFSISLSLSVMLMVSLFDLIPESLPHISSGSILPGIVTFIVSFGMGILLVGILDKKITRAKGKGSGLYKLGILNFIALVLHNLPEGILTFMSTYQDFHLGLTICLSIALHNIPEGISIAVPIFYSTKSRWQAFKSVVMSALAEPFGALLAFVILKNFITDRIISIFLVLVAGIMTTLSIEKMLPEALSYNKKGPLIAGLILGIAIVLASLFIL